MDETNSKGVSKSKFPSISADVFKIVEGFKDGKSFKFSIQEIPSDRFEEVVQHMCTYFIEDEPTLSSMNVKGDLMAYEDLRKLLIHILSDGMSVGAFLENSDGENSSSKLVAVNNLYFKDEKREQYFKKFWKNRKSDKIFKAAKAMDETVDLVDIENIYGTDKYLSSFGLSTEPYFRGMSLGYHLLLARDEIGRKHGIPATITVFSNPISAKLAERAGFALLSEKLIDEIVDENGKIMIPNCKTKYLKCMGKSLTTQ